MHERVVSVASYASVVRAFEPTKDRLHVDADETKVDRSPKCMLRPSSDVSSLFAKHLVHFRTAIAGHDFDPIAVEPNARRAHDA